MKPIMRNTLLGSLLLMAAAGTAQQSTAPARASSNGRGSADAAPVAAGQVAQIAGNGQVMDNDNMFFVSGNKTFKPEDLKSKEVSKEISIGKSSDIYIENTSSRGIVVKTWDQPKVKVSTVVYYDGESKLTDEEWLEKINLSLKTLGSSVKIKSGGVGSSFGGAYTIYSDNLRYTTSGGGVAVFNANGQNIGTDAKLKRVITITVPSGSKLDIETKYSDVQLPAGITEATVDISNGNLEADNLDKLTLRSKYSNANVGNIKTAELEFANGRFSAKDVDDMDVESKYSTIEMASAKKISLRSTNDEYEIEEAGEVTGRKNYGNLRITKLNGSMEVDGSNADIKVRKVGPSLNHIKIDNRYADIRIPLKEVKNYSVSFSGPYSSVYGSFEKVPVTTPETKSDAKEGSTAATTTINSTAPQAASLNRLNTMIADVNRVRVGSWSDGIGNGPTRFTAAVGDGKGLKIDMKCQNCTVDFK